MYHPDQDKRLIPRKYTPYVFAFFMALLMSCFMSFVISVLNVGLDDEIISIWLKAWGYAFTVAFPTVIIISPVVRKLVKLLVDDTDPAA